MQTLIEIVIGIVLAIGFIWIIRRSGSYAKEKISIAVGLIIAAVIYFGFGLFSGSLWWILTELAGVAIYAVFASLGVKKSGWYLAAGWALHPLWDAALHDYSTPFVPHWYINGCIGFDLLVAAYVAYREK